MLFFGKNIGFDVQNDLKSIAKICNKESLIKSQFEEESSYDLFLRHLIINYAFWIVVFNLRKDNGICYCVRKSFRESR